MMDETMATANTLQSAGEVEFVEVMFARTMEEARDCVSFLLERDVPARIESQPGMQPAYGVAVLVPGDRMIEASEMLAARADDEEEEEEEEDEFEDDLEDDFDDDEDDDFDDDEDDGLDDDDEELEEEEEEEV